MAQRVGRGIALLFHDLFSSTPRPHFTPGKDPVPILLEAGWAPGPIWTGGKPRRHRDSIPDRPARSQSLYRLSYPAHIPFLYHYEFCTRSLFCTNSVVTPKTFSHTAPGLAATDFHLFEALIDAIHGKRFRAVRLLGKNSPSEFCDCFVLFQTWVWSCVVVLKDDFTTIFVTLVKLFCKV